MRDEELQLELAPRGLEREREREGKGERERERERLLGGILLFFLFFLRRCCCSGIPDGRLLLRLSRRPCLEIWAQDRSFVRGAEI